MPIVLRRGSAVLLGAAVAFGLLTASAATATPAATTSAATSALRGAAPADANARVDHLRAVAGDSQEVPTGTQAPVQLAVQALDGDYQPVEGATVTFSTPGPGLKFPDGTDDATVVTDAEGMAVAPELTAAGAPGPDWSRRPPTTTRRSASRSRSPPDTL